MYFALDEEQAMIADSASRVLADNFGRDVIHRFAAYPAVDEKWTRLFGETGLMGVCASPDVGGLGMGCVAALAVACNAGANVVPYPLSEGICAAAALTEMPDGAAAIIEGRAIVAIADANASVEQSGDGMSLSGALGPVEWAAQADGLIVGANALYYVDMKNARAILTSRKGIDATVPVAEVTLTDAPARLLAAPPEPWRQMRAVLAAAELEGAARTCLNLALDHMKSRRQFGQEIGKFQALKHIAASDALHLESMSVANAYAAWAIDAGACDAAEAVAIAKSFASETARVVAQDSIQCHGGIGFTWDYGLHFYLRRILRLSASLGTVHDQRERLFEIVAASRPVTGS